jgi:tripartite-type tricarboxylate transporter receptor subunit TctC
MHSVMRALLLAATLAITAATHAQTYPNRPVRLVVPFAPGGSADAIARPLAERLGAALGQQVVVDNRPGALTVIGADAVAKAAPDGYTLYLMPGTHVLTPLLVAKVPYDVVNDFTPVALLGTQPYFLFANNEQPYKSFAELIAFAKANPEKVSIGVSDAVTQTIASALERSAGIKLNIIAYKSGGPQNIDLLGNQIAMAVGTPNMMQYVQQGKIRPLAATTLKPASWLPAVPAINEQIPGSNFEIQTWYAVAGPANMPANVVEHLRAEITKVMALPDIARRMTELGVVAPPDNSPSAMRAMMNDYRSSMGRRMQDAGITPQ